MFVCLCMQFGLFSLSELSLWYGFSHVVCRAGACPTNGGKLPSTSSCTCDCDCPGKLKCCAYGTIRTCVQSTSGKCPCFCVIVCVNVLLVP
uniref:WAP domain-containing protein n=1 Tax=Paramormyrops kingsleyae TaxID=1676925 RepID=A0A3B3R4G3_9TELE